MSLGEPRRRPAVDCNDAYHLLLHRGEQDATHHHRSAQQKRYDTPLRRQKPAGEERQGHCEYYHIVGLLADKCKRGKGSWEQRKYNQQPNRPGQHEAASGLPLPQHEHAPSQSQPAEKAGMVHFDEKIAEICPRRSFAKPVGRNKITYSVVDNPIMIDRVAENAPKEGEVGSRAQGAAEQEPQPAPAPTSF